MTMRYSYPKEKIRILLLEGVHAGAIDTFNTAGYDARVLKTALPEEEMASDQTAFALFSDLVAVVSG